MLKCECLSHLSLNPSSSMRRGMQPEDRTSSIGGLRSRESILLICWAPDNKSFGEVFGEFRSPTMAGSGRMVVGCKQQYRTIHTIKSKLCIKLKVNSIKINKFKFKPERSGPAVELFRLHCSYSVSSSTDPPSSPCATPR